MEFNGINNETNGIDGFERRLSERASAIDYWLSEVKSINQLAGEKKVNGINQTNLNDFWWMSWWNQ